MKSTDLVIIGAGPFGLAMAREARRGGIDHVVLGRPMEFWRDHMPAGMCLRSGVGWQLDPAEELTFEAFLAERGVAAQEVLPLPLSMYLDYVDWFGREAGIEVDERLVQQLRHDGAVFTGVLDDGSQLQARRVLVAVGFHAFAHVPAETSRLLPEGRWRHTRDCVDLEAMRDRRVLIVGGRQSAFEWAALMCEAGAAAVHIAHRHRSPAFAPADWSWVPDLVGRLEHNPSWYRSLPEGRREEIARRFWEEGRLKVEPWLEPRIDHEIVTLWPNNVLRSCESTREGALQIGLDSGDAVQVDEVVFATGYRVDIRRIPWIDPALLEQIELNDGFPALDTGMQSSVPGLFFTSMAATRDFGPFMAFTVSVAATTRMLGRVLLEHDAATAG